MEKGVSVIIPVYNGEKFLKKLVDDIMNNASDEVFVIISDNGSTDQTPQIMIELKQKYTDRVKLVYPKDNKTKWLPSNSRQQGMDAVETQFFTFCDVDDWWNWAILKEIADIMIKENLDVYGGGYYYRDIEGNIIGQKNHSYNIGEYINAEYFYDCMCQPRVYRTEYIRNENIVFPVQSYFEDACFSLACLAKTDRIKVTDKCIYNYLINPNSFTHKKHIIKRGNLPILWLKDYVCNIDNQKSTVDKQLANWRLFMLITEIVYQPVIIRIAKYSIKDAWYISKEMRNIIKTGVDLENCKMVEKYLKETEKLSYKYYMLTTVYRILYKTKLDRIFAVIATVVGRFVG